MGYDLYWVNDPHVEERRGRVERFGEETSDPFEAISGMYAVAEQDGAYFRASLGVMAAVRHELLHQGLDELAGYFVANQGTVSPAVIRSALARIADSPTMPADVSNPFDDWLGARGLPDDDSSIAVTIGGESLMDAPPGTWQTKWAKFVSFLRGAAEHGGVRVE